MDRTSLTTASERWSIINGQTVLAISVVIMWFAGASKQPPRHLAMAFGAIGADIQREQPQKQHDHAHEQGGGQRRKCRAMVLCGMGTVTNVFVVQTLASSNEHHQMWNSSCPPTAREIATRLPPFHTRWMQKRWSSTNGPGIPYNC